MHCIRLLIVVALAWARVAAAEPTTKDLYDSGLRHYNVSEYDLALADFKGAYQRSGSPELLYNIAQCYRAMGDPGRAQTQYRAYLREKPDAPNRADVEKLIAAMDTAIKAQKQPPTEATPPPGSVTAAPGEATSPSTAAPASTTAAPAAATLTSAPAERRPLYKKPWLWGVVAGAVVLVAGGITVGVILGTKDSTRTLADFRPMP
jgi:hypothetical protein